VFCPGNMQCASVSTAMRMYCTQHCPARAGCEQSTLPHYHYSRQMLLLPAFFTLSTCAPANRSSRVLNSPSYLSQLSPSVAAPISPPRCVQSQKQAPSESAVLMAVRSIYQNERCDVVQGRRGSSSFSSLLGICTTKVVYLLKRRSQRKIDCQLS